MAKNLSLIQRQIYDLPFRNHAPITTSLPIEYKYQEGVRMLPKNIIYDKVFILRPDMEIIDYRLIENNHFQDNSIYYISPNHLCIDFGWGELKIQ